MTTDNVTGDIGSASTTITIKRSDVQKRISMLQLLFENRSRMPTMDAIENLRGQIAVLRRLLKGKIDDSDSPEIPADPFVELGQNGERLPMGRIY